MCPHPDTYGLPCAAVLDRSLLLVSIRHGLVFLDCQRVHTFAKHVTLLLSRLLMHASEHTKAAIDY